MVADLFKRDYRQMTEQGVKFTPEDIIRLNALAVKVKLAPNAAQTVGLPRCACLGDLVLREPTIAHELWIEEASRWIDCSDDRNFLWLHAYALSRPAEELADAYRPEKLVRTVFTYAAKRLCRFTHEQLKDAVEYALVGADWKVGERPAERKAGASSASSPHTPPSPALGLLVDAKALRVPITVEEARRMTASEVEEAINRALILDRKVDPAASRERALADYVRAREEIRARFKAPTAGDRTARSQPAQGSGGAEG